MRYRVLPYRQGSRSAKALAAELGGKVLRLENSKYKWKPGDVVINWGNTSFSSDPIIQPLFNTPYHMRNVTNKRLFFSAYGDTGVLPKYWGDAGDIPDDAYPVVCRTVLAGHSGEGIVIAKNEEELVPAGLYTQYIKKKDEYRVHCGKEGTDEFTVISLQRKARRLNHENPNWEVRSHANGFVFVRSSVNPPACVAEAALRVFRKTGLDFGAVDVIYNEQQQRAYVLEINTAPGLEGQTVIDYANFFKGIT